MIPLMNGVGDDPQQLQAIIQQQNQAFQALNTQHTELSTTFLEAHRHVSTFASTIDNLALRDKIRAQIPAHINLEIKVDTLAEQQFANKLCKARKIELTRIDWGANIPLCEGFGALVSAARESNSVYLQSLNEPFLAQGILASCHFTDDMKQEFEKQITAVYWQGKKIEIIVPFDFSDNARVTITHESRVITFFVDTGKFFRFLFHW